MVTVTIGFVVRPHPHQPTAAADASASLSAATDVPAPVLSTLRRACFDCHSDETRWPWYARAPLASQLLERDVTEGRGQFNFSHWARYNPYDRADMLDKICRRASNRTMPPWQYRMMHAESRLSAAEVTALCAWSDREATRLVEEGR